MDITDRKILNLLIENARRPVKEIAAEVMLTPPAVSERIKKMEKEGIIAGYTVCIAKPRVQNNVSAIISMSLMPEKKAEFLRLAAATPQLERCHNVTGSYSFIAMVNCNGMEELEKIIGRFQQFGQTSTQIVLSTPVVHNEDFGTGQ